MSINTAQINEEVLYSLDTVARVDGRTIDDLKNRASRNRRQRARLCAHLDVEDATHEMFIVHTKDAYVRPHKHLNKSESLYIIEGTADLVLFDETGNINAVTHMAHYWSGGTFYHRIAEPYYHALLISSEVLVFYEATSGPFKATDTVWAPWAPLPEDTIGANNYMASLANGIVSFESVSEH